MSQVYLTFSEEKKAMDFSTEEDCRQIYRVFGEPQHIERQFPLFHQALQRARAGAPDEEQNGYVNWITIFAILYDPQTKELQIDFNITLKQTCAQLFAYVYNDDVSLFESLFYQSTQMTNTTCTFSNVELSKGDRFNMYVECPFVAGNETVLRGIRSVIKAEYSSDDVINRISVFHPSLLKNTKPPMKVVYGRTLGKGEVIDYPYPEVRTENGNQKVYLQVAGQVFLNEKFTLKNIMNTHACLMTGGQFGSIRYRNKTGAKLTPFADNKGLDYVFDLDWKDEIDQSVQYGQREYIFDLSILFQCNETGITQFRAHVSSAVKVPSPSEKQVPRIQLYWGCLGADSRVLLADGSRKIIKDIKIGDEVCTFKGTSCVTDKITGWEEKLYRLETKQGLIMEASIMHPVLTDMEFIPIRDVRPDTRVLTEDGIQAVRYCYETDYGREVYGLELDGAESFTANGVFVGTNTVQGRMLGISPYKESAVCRAFRAEFGKMVECAKERGFSDEKSIKDRY